MRSDSIESLFEIESSSLEMTGESREAVLPLLSGNFLDDLLPLAFCSASCSVKVCEYS
jgi:hypothetical protein